VRLQLNSTDITKDLIGKIEDICQEYTGNTPLYLKVRDDKENINLDLLSRRFRVNPINEMVRSMKKAGEVEVEVMF
jgi:DNA polymerase-3 subunit alpha